MMNVCNDAAVRWKVAPFVTLLGDGTKTAYILTDRVQANFPFENAFDSRNS